MKTLLQFTLVLLALLALSSDDTFGVEADVQHPCTSYTVLKQPERRIGNIINLSANDTLVCDRSLKRGWYRFKGPGGGTMPTQCVEVLHCGTHAPVWFKGKHPAFVGGVLDGEACVSLTGNCCELKWKIKVANCGSFFTYLLTDTPGCFIAYCAGNESPCALGESSRTGFTPNCSDNFPRIEGNARVTVDKEGDKVAFYCDYDGTIQTSSIVEVQWFVEGDNTEESEKGESPVFEDDMRNKRSRSVLQESHWIGKIGSTIYCQMRARWSNGTGSPSPIVQSNKYFAGIKILNRVIKVSENEKEAHIHIQSTIPVVCKTNFKGLCKVTVELAYDNRRMTKSCAGCSCRDVVLGDCSVDITPDNWQQVHSVSVKAVRDFNQDGTKHMRVNFKAVYSTILSSVWDNYMLPEVKVITDDSPTGTCSSVGDPHYTTFDGLYYHVYLEGEFVLYKHTEFPFQINTRLEKCGKYQVGCNCGVAVMADDDVIVIDRCKRRIRNLAFGRSFPGGWSSLHWHELQQGDSFVEGLQIYEYNDGRRYTVHLPTGAYIDVHVMSGYMNIVLHASSDDWMATRGLCGTFDKDASNDFTLKDKATHTTAHRKSACGKSNDVCKFAETWRVRNEDSLFGQVVNPGPTQHGYQIDKRYCKCEKGGGKGNIVCDYNYDVYNCQATKQKGKGSNKTGTRKRQSPPNTGRRRRSVEPDEASDDYFDSEFVYDETFRGTVPSWPTPSGVTEAQAREYCNNVTMRSTTGRVCQHIVQERLRNIIVDECMVDIKVTDDFTWALSSLNKLSSECENQIYQKAEYWKLPEEDGEPVEGEVREPPIGQLLLDSVCPGGCSLRGECRKGKCHCQNGYDGDDCSTNLLEAPAITYISSGGVCDVRIQPCQSIKVYGTGFRRKENLTCHFRTHTDEIIQTDARFVTFEEITCRLPEHDVTPMNPDTQRGSPSEAFRLSIFQSGTLSEEEMMLIYDSTCQMCVDHVSHYECVQKEDTCLVNGYCFEHDEKHPEDCCRLCDPSRSNDTLVGFKSNRAPMLRSFQTSFNAYIGEPWKLNIQASDPEGCQVMYDVTPVDQTSFDLDVTSSGVSAELEAHASGTYAFNVTAQDECGASVTQQYSVYLMSRFTSTTTSTTQPTTTTTSTTRPTTTTSTTRPTTTTSTTQPTTTTTSTTRPTTTTSTTRPTTTTTSTTWPTTTSTTRPTTTTTSTTRSTTTTSTTRPTTTTTSTTRPTATTSTTSRPTTTATTSRPTTTSTSTSRPTTTTTTSTIQPTTTTTSTTKPTTTTTSTTRPTTTTTSTTRPITTSTFTTRPTTTTTSTTRPTTTTTSTTRPTTTTTSATQPTTIITSSRPETAKPRMSRQRWIMCFFRPAHCLGDNARSP